MKREIRLSEKAMYCTVRLEYTDSNNYSKLGTGFIFKFFRNKDNSIPVIVTNKHIVYDAINLKFYLNRSDNDNWPLHGNPIEVPLDNLDQNQIIYHQDPKVDLALIPIGGIINKILEDGERPFYTAIDSSTIPTDDEWEQYHALEDVLVIGYPNGEEDIVNKLPIFIKGNLQHIH